MIRSGTRLLRWHRFISQRPSATGSASSKWVSPQIASLTSGLQVSTRFMISYRYPGEHRSATSDWVLRAPVALVTWHPVTRNTRDLETQLQILFKALQASNINALFTAANADAGGARINARLKSFCARNPDRFRWVAHLGHLRYLNSLAHFDLMVGNSSSGLTEAPSSGCPWSILVIGSASGARSPNVIDVPCTRNAILKGIKWAISARFRSSLRGMRNPYDRFHDGRASERIKEAAPRDTDISGEFLKKRFHDLR